MQNKAIQKIISKESLEFVLSSFNGTIRTIIPLALILASLLSLTACGISVSNGDSKWPNASDPEKNKPMPGDFVGTPGDFAGRWEGPCTQFQSGTPQTNCSATLSLNQGALKTYIIGSITYIASGKSIGPITLRRLDIDGNDLKYGGSIVGKIGVAALEFYDPTFGDFSAKIFGGNALGVNASQMPAQRSIKDCPANYCFTASLTRSTQ